MKRAPDGELTVGSRAKRPRASTSTSDERTISACIALSTREDGHASSSPSLGVVKIIADKDKVVNDTPHRLARHCTLELQTHRCLASRLYAFPRCIACIKKVSGETCRFLNFRYLLRDQEGRLVGVSFGEGRSHATPTPLEPLEWKWNIALGLDHIDRVKRTVAKALLPVLKQEQEHFQLPGVIRRLREAGVRATCDACMTSIFSRSWMCRTCGREACIDCFVHVSGLSESPTKPPQRGPFFLPCTNRNHHQPTDFSPISRFYEAELTQAVHDIEAMSPIAIEKSTHLPKSGDSVAEPLESESSLDGPLDVLPPATMEPMEVPAILVHSPESTIFDYSLSDGADLPTTISAHSPGPELALAQSPSSEPEPPATISASKETFCSHDTTIFPCSELTEEVFQKFWSSGDPLIVTGVLSKFRIDWSPEYFSSHYGSQRCTIVECQSNMTKEVSVAKFFSKFGNYKDRRGHWKLKDWPPSADFQSTFPELYDDFAQATPVPNYVRRDGVLNIASHFPSNVVRPDLGPKMYNAMASFESPGSQGSTRLHMDMADAINIMTYASQAPDGSPGCAAWDIYKAADSPKLRDFLQKKFEGQSSIDPIHAQCFYLDSSLRAELYKDYGVVSHRIYQKPGEAVFIPAGCAHQVCNLADCIKVACDFVSPENIERCEVLTREFRELNQLKAWKEDVLQLRTMMWFAWVSCVRQEKQLLENDTNLD